MTDQQQQAKIQTAVSAVKADLIRVQERLLELERLVASKPTVGDQVKALFEFYHAQWGLTYHGNYAFAGGKDASGFKRLLKDFSPDEIRNRIVRYLKDPDAFFAMQRHPLGTFFSQINRFGADARTADARPVGCSHNPPCKTDVEHTRLLMQQRRAVNCKQ